MLNAVPPSARLTMPDTPLLAAALYAMTRFAQRPSAAQAALVARHLDCLATPTDASPHSALCAALAMRWRGRAISELSSSTHPPLMGEPA